jgi:rSAM/selenodomain-associated transferase 1
MAKPPVAGSVKTRLVPPLTQEQAAELYSALLLDQLEHLTSLDIADLFVAVEPGEGNDILESLMPARYTCFPQRGADLGERMREVFAELWRRGHREVILIGSDLPPVPLDTLREGFAALLEPEKRVILGPSLDGGYYLIGMNQPVPELFSHMTWSHDGVAAETLARLARLRIPFGLVRESFDIDRVEDLERLRRLAEPNTRAAMKKTLAFLDALALDGK